MNKSDGGADCTWGSVVMAALIAALATVVMRFFAELSWTGSIFVGAIAFAVLVLLFIWIFCRELPALGDIEAPGANTGAKPASDSGASDAGSASVAPATTSSPVADTPADTAAAPTATAGAAPTAAVKSTQLPGQEELAARKGEWRYDGGDTAKASAPAPASAAADTGDKDYDGDGVVEGTDEGQRPEGLTEARGGKADNLKEIKGIGPKLEKLCNSLGFYHFDQIAAWTSDEIAWVDANLEGFKGRVTRDEWVAQAKVLAAGGETEFSKRVEDGDVY